MSTFYGKNDYRNYLMHYGVPGMRWRRHKYTGSGSEDFNYTTLMRPNTRTYSDYRSPEYIRERVSNSRTNRATGNVKGARSPRPFGWEDDNKIGKRYNESQNPIDRNQGQANAKIDNERFHNAGTTAQEIARDRLGIGKRGLNRGSRDRRDANEHDKREDYYNQQLDNKKIGASGDSNRPHHKTGASVNDEINTVQAFMRQRRRSKRDYKHGVSGRGRVAINNLTNEHRRPANEATSSKWQTMRERRRMR